VQRGEGRMRGRAELARVGLGEVQREVAWVHMQLTAIRYLPAAAACRKARAPRREHGATSRSSRSRVHVHVHVHVHVAGERSAQVCKCGRRAGSRPRARSRAHIPIFAASRAIV
jgi:hypothetical protein